MRIIKRLAAKSDLTLHLVFFAEEAGVKIARRFRLTVYEGKVLLVRMRRALSPIGIDILIA